MERYGASEQSQRCKQINIQYDGSNDDLDWRIDFKYFDFILIVKYLRFTLIKDCSIKSKCLSLKLKIGT